MATVDGDTWLLRAHFLRRGEGDLSAQNDPDLAKRQCSIAACRASSRTSCLRSLSIAAAPKGVAIEVDGGKVRGDRDLTILTVRQPTRALLRAAILCSGH